MCAIVGYNSYSVYLWHMAVARWVVPRLSRYGTLGNYYSSALYQAKDLFRQRFLLVDDANRLINQMLSDMLAGGLLH